MNIDIRFAKRKDGVSLAYSTFGSGPVLVFATPWVSDISFSLEDPHTIKYFSELANDFTIVVYDKHGCGQSDRNRSHFTLESEVLDLETIIDHIGLDSFILYG